MKQEHFVNFGFKKVFREQKEKLVKEVFDNVAFRYDLMNDLISLGVHRLWKHKFVKQLLPSAKNILLDVGGGTGDIALNFLKQGGKHAYIVDINYNMLHQGVEKFLNAGFLSSIDFLCGNAENLPIRSNSVNTYSIAFCIRNTTDLNKVLVEAFRVLKPGGKFCCLEFSSLNNPLFSKAYDVWSFMVLPKIGKFITKNAAAYEYLVESIRQFPNQEDFKSLITAAGFKTVDYTNLSMGITCIHSGIK